MDKKSFKDYITASSVVRKKQIHSFDSFVKEKEKNQNKLDEKTIPTKYQLERFFEKQLGLKNNSVDVSRHVSEYMGLPGQEKIINSVNRIVTAKDLNDFFDLITPEKKQQIRSALSEIPPAEDDTTMTAVILKNKTQKNGGTLPFTFGILIVHKYNKYYGLKGETEPTIYLISTIIKNDDRNSKITPSQRINNLQQQKDITITVDD